MLTSLKECGTIRDLLAGHALQTLGPDDSSAVTTHVTHCGGSCRDEYDRVAAVPDHLTLLREALLCERDAERRTRVADRRECAHVPVRRRHPARAASARRLTLAQWVSRTACVR
ncbi:zf-HC2 domain-containing protein [Streptomyces sp. NPDC096934]|uniref:zf-HC2 domain-containing protein n=1 Tax=unclassified Streptomyces TaxID=2593676 RepID=UPI00331AB554